MTVRREGDLILLEGECRVEEAEALTAMLQGPGGPATVDWSGCTGLHGALVQTLIVFAPNIVGRPQDEFLRDFVSSGFPSRERSEQA